MYCSPFRKENHPSFKVDYYLNLWRDFGSGEGGSIIDLVMKMETISFHEAASKLEKKYETAGIETATFSFHRDKKLLYQQSHNKTDSCCRFSLQTIFCCAFVV
ncbi:DNA primase [termite gut metagenome]|uniref:DNA primase n=1 Tax=termite gut metagenome TaxID=433724 RepID=A0A5J4P717_9ZZZZ